MKLTIGIILILLFSASCARGIPEDKVVDLKIFPQDSLKQDSIIYSPFNRKIILDKLNAKKAKRIPLIVHCFVPLCDNESQGIVPVNSSLGDGDNLRTNLYWGAGYGVKSYFKKLKDWKLVYSQSINDTILERVVFKKTYYDSTIVYFIADAYNGNKMKQCLTDYTNSMNGLLNSTITIEDSLNLEIHSKADLVIFNGHNGLMDEEIPILRSKFKRKNDAMAIACYSFSYFKEYWYYTNSYPLLSTTHLLAPEAYTIEAATNSWAKGKSNIEIRDAAAKAYSDKHSCTYKTAQKLFKTGW